MAHAHPHAQRITRYIVGLPGEPAVGDGFHHPRAAVREQRRAEELAAMGEPAATEYVRRL